MSLLRPARPPAPTTDADAAALAHANMSIAVGIIDSALRGAKHTEDLVNALLEVRSQLTSGGAR